MLQDFEKALFDRSFSKQVLREYLAFYDCIVVNSNWDKEKLLLSASVFQMVCNYHIKDLVIAWVLDLSTSAALSFQEELNELFVLEERPYVTVEDSLEEFVFFKRRVQLKRSRVFEECVYHCKLDK